MKKVLVIGATGLIGSALINKLDDSRFSVLGTYMTHKKKGYEHLSISDRNSVFSLFDKIRPDIAILTAAFSYVDGCETNKELANRINIKGTRNVVDACGKYKTKLVFTSSYYVFDGSKRWYAEKDKQNPLNYYGITKMKGEELVKQLGYYLIVRLTNVFDFGLDEKNFVVRMVRSLRYGNEVKAPNDQYTNPITATNVAELVNKLLLDNKVGIYHVGGSEYINRYDFAVKVAKFLGLDYNLINSVDTKDLFQKAKRPSCGLKTEKIQKELNVKMLNVEGSLKLIKERIGMI